MKNKLLVSSFRRIKSSYKRFLSLLLMSLLGVGFFCGIKAASPDMLISLDKYLDELNVYDIEIVSSLGLTYEDIIELEKLDISENIVGIKSTDEVVILNDTQKSIRITSITNMNDVILKDGRMPLSNNEIIVSEKLLNENNLSIDDYITIDSDNLHNEMFRIVGSIESPLFFAPEYMGTTTVGNGELNYYSYVLENAFNTSIYTSATLTLNGAKELKTSTEKYENLVEKSKNKIEEIKQEREEKRFNDLFQNQIDYMDTMGVEYSLDDFPKSVWYIFDRNDNGSYSTFKTMLESITKLGNVFPILFYLVAILISLISMARMVDEDRTEIGTLRGLGFSKSHIMSKYLVFSFIATTTGGIIGMLIGFNLFPQIIWSIYKGIFRIPKFIYEFNLYYAFIGLSVALVCICGVSVITVNKALKEKPSQLMRPKAPVSGKKIFLEKMHFIWDKLNFSNKITIRNIFRYKSRIIITIVGISCSTALIMTGFGLKDSANSISSYHYSNVHLYDEMIYLMDNPDLESIDNLLNTNEDILHNIHTYYEVIDIYTKEKQKIEADLIVPENKEELHHVISLNDINNNFEQIEIKKDKIVVTEKLAYALDVTEGDKLYLLINDEYKEIEIYKVVENYIGNYVFIDKETYEEYFQDYKTNMIMLKTNENFNEAFINDIIDNKSVSNTLSQKTMLKNVNEVLESLDSVIIVLILSSATLAFIILYNLSNINISERKREISTLKVLGFYDEEVDSYITRENYFITIVGILLGIFMGGYISHFVIKTCEPHDLLFLKQIKTSSYIISALIASCFTIIVSFITHYSLKKIDMIESLKSNE